MTNEELTAQYYDGNRLALHELYEQNTGYFKTLAKSACNLYCDYIHDEGLREDLEQIAALEFLERIMKRQYKPELGKVLTYVTPYIKNKLIDYIAECSSVVHLSSKSFGRINQCKKLFHDGMTTHEISQKLGIGVETVRRCINWSYWYKTIIMGHPDDDYGLDYIDESRIGVNEQHPDDKVYVKWRSIYLRELFDSLSARERKIVGHYFGVFGYEKMSDTEIGDLMLITRDAVNKAVHTALDKLKNIYYCDSMLKRWREAHWLVWDEIGE